MYNIIKYQKNVLRTSQYCVWFQLWNSDDIKTHRIFTLEADDKGTQFTKWDFERI